MRKTSWGIMRSKKILILIEGSYTKKQAKRGEKSEASIIDRVLEILEAGRCCKTTRLPQGGVDRYLDYKSFESDLEGRGWLGKFQKIIVVLDADRIREGSRLERLREAQNHFKEKVCYLVAWENPEAFMEECIEDDKREHYKSKLSLFRPLANSRFVRYLSSDKVKNHPFSKALLSALRCKCPEFKP